MVNYADELDIWKDRINDRITKLEETIAHLTKSNEELRQHVQFLLEINQ